MARRSLKSDDVEGFMVAVWDELVDTEQLYGVTVLMDVRRGKRRGELSFHAHAYKEREDSAEWLIAASEAFWPSAKYTSLHALLFNLASKLNIGVQRWQREQSGEWYSSPRDEPADSV